MKSTTRFTKNKKGIECLNCKQPISDNDNFCSNCGQVNDELPLSIKQFISEFFSGFFSFDSRFFKTFRPLLFQPGKVSKDYVLGKRRRYVSPFQLYLHVTIIFFLLQGLFSALDEYRITDSISKNRITEQNDSTLIKANEGLAKPEIVENLSNTSNNDSIDKKSSDSIVNIYEKYIEKSGKNSILRIGIQKTKYHIDSVFNFGRTLELLDNDSLNDIKKDSIFNNYFESNRRFIEDLTNSNNVENWSQISSLSLLKEFSINYTDEVFRLHNIDYDIPEKNKISVEDEMIKGLVGNSVFKKISDFMAYDNEHKNITVLEALDSLSYEKTRMNIFYYKKAQDLNNFKDDADFRKSYIDEIISRISIALFFLLPIFTLFMSLLYIRHKWNYTEHLVFVFNVQTVFFLLLIFFNIFDRVLDTDSGTLIFVLLFLFYLFKALRNFYGQHWFKTFVKFFLLNIFYFILSTLGLVIISFIAFVL